VRAARRFDFDDTSSASNRRWASCYVS